MPSHWYGSPRLGLPGLLSAQGWSVMRVGEGVGGWARARARARVGEVEGRGWMVQEDGKTVSVVSQVAAVFAPISSYRWRYDVGCRRRRWVRRQVGCMYVCRRGNCPVDNAPAQ